MGLVTARPTQPALTADSHRVDVQPAIICWTGPARKSVGMGLCMCWPATTETPKMGMAVTASVPSRLAMPAKMVHRPAPRRAATTAALSFP